MAASILLRMSSLKQPCTWKISSRRLTWLVSRFENAERVMLSILIRKIPRKTLSRHQLIASSFCPRARHRDADIGHSQHDRRGRPAEGEGKGIEHSPLEPAALNIEKCIEVHHRFRVLSSPLISGVLHRGTCLDRVIVIQLHHKIGLTQRCVWRFCSHPYHALLIVMADSKLPTLHTFDHAHMKLGCSTFATDLRSVRLNASKSKRSLSAEAITVEAVRRLNEYKREIRFFRAVHNGSEGLVTGIRSVVQQMILNYYLRPEIDGERDEQWLELSAELDINLNCYTASVNAAEADWLELSSRQAERDCSSKAF